MELDEASFRLFAPINYAIACGLVAHVAFLVLFAALGVFELAAFNVYSVILFGSAVWLCRRARLAEALLMATAEVVAHAWYATALLGWDAAFHFHILLTMVMVAMMTVLDLRRRLALTVAQGAAYGGLAVYARLAAPLHPLHPDVDAVFTGVNVVVFTGVLGGLTMYYALTGETVREQRDQAERELRDALVQTQQLERLKSDFTAMVSHELRTPLTSILGFAKVIKARLDDRILPEVRTDDRKVTRAVEQVRGNIDIVITEGERLTALINDVLDIAKMEAGHMEYARETVIPGELAERACAASAGLFADGSVSLTTSVDGAPEALVGDPARLQQVLINLISNARKFTEAGTVVVRVAGVAGAVRFSVTDTGSGIPAADQPRVFDRFKQAGTLDDKPRGTGLGLAICKQIVEAHGGTIALESAVGVGSTFHVQIPAAAQAARP